MKTRYGKNVRADGAEPGVFFGRSGAHRRHKSVSLAPRQVARHSTSNKTPKLGQHFLNNPVVARTLVEAAGIMSGDTVVEIGPGTGALTKELLKTGAQVLAIEKDPALVEKLRSIFASEIEGGKLELHEQDVRDFVPRGVGLMAGQYVLAANIPYYITGEIIRQFLETKEQPRTIALLIQKEVAERIVARDGKESILSLSVKVYGTPKIVRKVPAGNFTPPPSVDSAILAITNISKDAFTNTSEEKFFTVVRAGFAAKRKVLRSNLARVFGAAIVRAAMLQENIPENARAEDLDTSIWQRLAAAF